MNRISRKILLAALPPLYVGLTRLLFTTCRVEIRGLAYRRQAEASGPFIAAFWHYSTYFTIHQSRGLSMVAMVSGSRDGEFMARILELLGYITVRGSRKKQGLAALKEMITLVKQGRTAGIVADGSQGPARVVQAGAVLLASRTAAPIVPMVWSADRYYVFGSWDRSILPKPFARVVFSYGEPVKVPEDLKSQELQEYRLLLEDRLNRLYCEAWNIFGREEH